MTKKTKKLYNLSRNDKLFMSALKKHEPQYCTVDWFFPQSAKTIIAAIYMGYLIANDKYNESDYED